MRPFLPLLLLATLFLWAGLVAGISFLEAPLKFTAPGITIPLGLGIGRLVFQALNKVEIGLCALAASCAVALEVPRRVGGAVVALCALLLLQTFWLLPALDVRAEAMLTGNTPPDSFLHLYYIAAEVAKLLLLLTAGTLAYQATCAPLAPALARS